MLGLNAAVVYDFDVDALQKLAADVGPTPAELGQVDDDANRAYWAPAKERGRFWLGVEDECNSRAGSRSSPVLPVGSARRSATASDRKG